MARRNKPAGSTREERDRIALGKLESFIDKTLDGQMMCPSCRKDYDIKDIPTSAVTLWRARYDKLRPSLASTEVTVHDPRDSQDATQLAARLAALFNERPDLFDQVVALKSSSASQQPASAETEHRVSH